ncbi:hypothetical protein AMAG_03190 [Allomyces macrogynus ATCC 38327]|uniref:SP-RING-type domain-containing protein n=1 Tax=Allomyces macrogynus (strain ATCC 38327) TaxID=578462 RepID=A0A0L0S505_ALLM3|nr:hypothetical protein AMAG_03190 [Allomyces macrogynus ATCC 38327]|eukprot:KNE57481.1 hypothetical protein AMAG_03190 [Allomyces macrogynus ATCC 38327]
MYPNASNYGRGHRGATGAAPRLEPQRLADFASENQGSLLHDYDKVIAEMEQAIELVTSVAEDCEENGFEDQVKSLCEDMPQYDTMRHRLQHDQEALRQLVQGLINGQSYDSEKALTEAFETALRKQLRGDTEPTSQHQFRERIYGVKQNPDYAPPLGDDDDLVVVSDRLEDFRCPITGRTIDDPLKSKVCNHVYEAEAIRGFIRDATRRREQAECPTTGCNKILSLSDLVKDAGVERRLRRYLTQRQRDEEMEYEAL